MPPLTLHTPRLTLRRWQESDLVPFAAINQDPLVTEFTRPLSPQESQAFVQKIERMFVDKGFGLFAVERKDTGEFIGFTGLWIPMFEAHFTPCVDIGWRLSSKHWGLGFTTEAAKECLRFAFQDLKLAEVLSFTVPQNIRSRRVMEKLGMVHNPDEDFDYPGIEDGHPLQKHVLYRKSFSFFDLSSEALAKEEGDLNPLKKTVVP